MPTVCLGLGSNIEPREEYLDQGLRLLKERGVIVIDRSARYHTEPVDIDSDHWFVNAAVRVETDLEPNALVLLCREIEKACGRTGREKVTDRTLDIDILLYDDIVVDSEELHIPHRRMLNRRFVLVPLAEIASAVIHPRYRRRIGRLLEECTDPARVEPI